MIKRELESVINKKLFKGKAIVLLGPRQTGKTTLVKSIVQESNIETLWLSGDDYLARHELGKHSLSHLRSIIGKHKMLVVDEAQNIDNIGLTLKIIVDNIPDVQVIATGSSSFELGNVLNEPLTGRKFEYMLYPVSYYELVQHNGLIAEKGLLGHRMVYGSYPEVASSQGEEKELLQLLASSYLYKDLFIHQQIKKPQLIEKLTKALALQVSSEVSYNELARTIGADIQTVEKYIDMLEKAFIVFRLHSLSRNLRNELKRARKIYFYDNGIRNTIIGNYSPLSSRTDVGALWENYFVAERQKFLQYNKLYTNRYFWRNHAQQEIDYIEDRGGKLRAFELKWNPKKKGFFSKSFLNAYPDSEQHLINKENFAPFLNGEHDKDELN